MNVVYLFDWGDTLMIDFPQFCGKMCDWKKVQAVDGAKETLENLSKKSKIYIATGAAASTQNDIKKAFARVNLDKYISGYFCKENINIDKGSPEFFSKILKQLNVEAKNVIVVGDSLQRDINPALELGINAIWFCNNKSANKQNLNTIYSLNELYLQSTK